MTETNAYEKGSNLMDASKHDNMDKLHELAQDRVSWGAMFLNIQSSALVPVSSQHTRRGVRGQAARVRGGGLPPPPSTVSRCSVTTGAITALFESIDKSINYISRQPTTVWPQTLCNRSISINYDGLSARHGGRNPALYSCLPSSCCPLQPLESSLEMGHLPFEAICVPDLVD